MTSPDTLPRPTDKALDHECPYEDRVTRTIGRFGKTGLALNYLAELVEQAHAGGECTSTHEGIYPTKAWSDLVRAT